MQIEYLTQMKNTPIIKGDQNRGISEQEIEKLEQKFNIQFPKAYKEFLFLGGKYQNCIDDWDTDYLYLDWKQENLHESMSNVNLVLSPIFVFAAYDTDQCLFFFLNEGENPSVYIYAEEKFHKNNNGEYVYYKKLFNSFSDCIDKSIDEALSK
ncbi:SMI1 / KNR4 family (SUKH-1) [Chryseobacterium taeanense]|uniref:SMI1 / KNR4 family (SUKH-1) n=1 Tax=Chryseobacterium taeanense TaxID=311334 RepID=A0A1G8KYM6_9FLAO|nr:SMI1/KNR4 family protein [Chryseobacterium taeanense]SDI48635.1 SMI1 / KNR4 family (SUKH-1) [Chryseobacterium taeanense]